MKKSFSIPGLFLLLVGALAQTRPPATGPVQPPTLREVAGIALQKNPGIHAADAYARTVQGGITAAKSFRQSLPTGAP
jgi:hypothetical protein